MAAAAVPTSVQQLLARLHTGRLAISAHMHACAAQPRSLRRGVFALPAGGAGFHSSLAAASLAVTSPRRWMADSDSRHYGACQRGGGGDDGGFSFTAPRHDTALLHYRGLCTARGAPAGARAAASRHTTMARFIYRGLHTARGVPAGAPAADADASRHASTAVQPLAPAPSGIDDSDALLCAADAATAGATAADGAGAPRKAAAAAAAASSPLSLLRIYAELSKARLSSLVVLTAGAGFLMAGAPGSWGTLIATLAGTTMAAAAAGVFNQAWEVRTDALMRRTAGRPLPAGRVGMAHALTFGGVLAAASVGTLAMWTNPLTAALGVANIGLYALVYTPLKVRSEWNTAVGAVVGAVPPLMGWAAATGSLWGAPEPLLLGAALFLWQFPHFYSLAWSLRKDYARGGYVMKPVLDASGGRTTAWASLRAAAALALLPFIAVGVGATGPMFAVEGVLLNAVFLGLARRFYSAPSEATARALFRFSLLYLPLLLAAAVFHSLQWRDANNEQHAAAAAAANTRWDAIAMTNEHAGVNTASSASPSAAASSRPPLVGVGGGSAAEGADDSTASGGSGGSSFGGFVEAAVLAGRAAGRVYCLHESIKDNQVAARAATVQALACVFPSRRRGGGDLADLRLRLGEGGGGEGAVTAAAPAEGAGVRVFAATTASIGGTTTSSGADAVTRTITAEDGGGGGPLISSSVAALAEGAARASVRGRCPVVALEAAGEGAMAELKAGVQGTAAGAASAARSVAAAGCGVAVMSGSSSGGGGGGPDGPSLRAVQRL